MKKMNGYRLQYWLYALFNNEFGRNCEFKRDPLHHMYSVNRHGFTVHDSFAPAGQVLERMVLRLRACGYEPDIRETQTKECVRLVKVRYMPALGKVERVYISLSVARVAYATKKDAPFVNVWTGVYYEKP